MIDRLAIVGVGLIGGSLARALRGYARERVGYDPRDGERALSLGVIDRCAASAAEAVKDADVVVVAVPVLQTRAALAAIRTALRDDAVITDVGSTKTSVLADAVAVFGEVPPRFVGGHPIAGTERSGVEASFAELFQGRRTILTPHPRQDQGALAAVRALWLAAGSVVVDMEPQHHDEVLAATSHLPHVLAYALVDQLAAMDARRELFAYAAGGFRDFTRIASSSPQMWHDIVRANREAVVGVIDGYLADLARLRDAIAVDDGATLLDCFTRARAARERYLELVEKPAAGAPA
jgi:prephenate dehydrogenase